MTPTERGAVVDRTWSFSIFQGGYKVAGGSGPVESDIRREAMHYGMMYAQDGPCIVKVRSRKRKSKP